MDIPHRTQGALLPTSEPMIGSSTPSMPMSCVIEVGKSRSEAEGYDTPCHFVPAHRQAAGYGDTVIVAACARTAPRRPHAMQFLKNQHADAIKHRRATNQQRISIAQPSDY